MIRVLVKTSSVIVRTGLEQMIASEPGFQLVSGDREGRTSGRITEEELPDVVISELDDSGEDAEWPEQLNLSGPDTAFLLLADDPSSLAGLEALRAGARGILPRRVSREELVAAVQAAAAGLFVLHRDGASSVFPPRPPAANRAGAVVEPLTAREKEVLSILAEGGSNKDIAFRLSISEHTAKFHVSSIIGKLGASSRTEAVTLAIRQGIIMV